MIETKDLYKVVGSMVDSALTDAGIPATRRRSDDEDGPISCRSVQISFDEYRVSPDGEMREVAQDVTVYFYAEDMDHPRDEAWTAANAIGLVFSAPIVIDGATVRVEDTISADMTSDVAEIGFTLAWYETVDISDYLTIDTLELEVE